MATKIEFSNKELYHAFDIDLFSPEEFIESFQNESVFEPETSQEEIDKHFEHELKQYLNNQESAWEHYLSFTDAIEEVIVHRDNTTFIVSDTKKLLKSILDCINGYGEFYFSNVKEFVNTTSGTPIKTIKSHFFWLKYYAEIYGRKSISMIMDDYANG